MPTSSAFTADACADDHGAQKAGDAELRDNPRARSAVLRVAEKRRGCGMSARLFLLWPCCSAMLASAIAVVYARHSHRQAFVALSKLQRAAR